jgi:hypothetical protein
MKTKKAGNGLQKPRWYHFTERGRAARFERLLKAFERYQEGGLSCLN